MSSFVHLNPFNFSLHLPVPNFTVSSLYRRESTSLLFRTSGFQQVCHRHGVLPVSSSLGTNVEIIIDTTCNMSALLADADQDFAIFAVPMLESWHSPLHCTHCSSRSADLVLRSRTCLGTSSSVTTESKSFKLSQMVRFAR